MFFNSWFSFYFPPTTIGIAWFIVWFMTKYIWTKDIYYKNLSWFWVKIFIFL
ncbi:MAG: cytochrome ubiquinol oxidase subunit I [Candidatus Hodarchaeota archaeon]